MVEVQPLVHVEPAPPFPVLSATQLVLVVQAVLAQLVPKLSQVPHVSSVVLPVTEHLHLASSVTSTAVAPAPFTEWRVPSALVHRPTWAMA